MITLFNNKITKDQLTSSFNDRALQFGDGLFETMRVHNNLVLLLNYHLKRLFFGAEALGLKLPDYLRKTQLMESITQLMTLNSIDDHATVKLIVWRQSEKQQAYASEDTLVNSLLSVKPARKSPGYKTKASFSEEVRICYWKLSQFKTTSALPYVIAARERDRRHVDEIILLNAFEQVAECTSSNIFWLKDSTYYTPSLKTGCIGGVMRSFLLDYFHEKNLPIHEVQTGQHSLLTADAVFTSNSTGLQIIRSIEGVTYTPPVHLLALINDLEKKLTQVK